MLTWPQIEAFPGPLSGYAWVRWGRRMPCAAAQAFMALQGQELEQQQDDALAACSQAMVSVFCCCVLTYSGGYLVRHTGAKPEQQ
ncbi:hypothetical protein DUNSADRAFT_7458 [Dunaliella salina]|uniref:Uncharacterized protein n=1 Tax=Dunaliella salina TaxID=3046 RepID=A0ABQ7GLL6_DUNSA|nr:hypothetical protein DUNSADRAFT_7458 [Dunaliella salina]|eukprot:KAF5835423.1 hypothetical protein DUNSADRAFT_7458 [Dunaliella salina]